MATLGMTKLEAVNEMLEAKGLKRVAALDTGGTSDAGTAEYVLDRIDRRIQEMGWPENTELAQSFTAAANAITVASDTLWIRGAFPHTHWRYVLRADGVFDVQANSLTITTGVVIVLDRIKKLTFADMAPRTKELIAVAAATIFQRRQRGEMSQDAWLTQEQVLVDLIADRVNSGMVPAPINAYPIFGRVASRQTQQPQ